MENTTNTDSHITTNTDSHITTNTDSHITTRHTIFSEIMEEISRSEPIKFGMNPDNFTEVKGRKEMFDTVGPAYGEGFN